MSPFPPLSPPSVPPPSPPLPSEIRRTFPFLSLEKDLAALAPQLTHYVMVVILFPFPKSFPFFGQFMANCFFSPFWPSNTDAPDSPNELFFFVFFLQEIYAIAPEGDFGRRDG